MVLSIAGALRRFSRKERGFTLIELVIVIAIIAILIAVAIPIYQNVTRSAAQKSHDTNLRVIDGAVQQYFMDKGEYPGAGPVSIGENGNLAGFLDEVPSIPELAKKELTGGESAADAYTLYVDAGGAVWAGPTGNWEGAYRKGK